MKRIFKFLVYLVLTSGLGLILYAYFGPFFGPTQKIERAPVILNEN